MYFTYNNIYASQYFTLPQVGKTGGRVLINGKLLKNFIEEYCSD